MIILPADFARAIQEKLEPKQRSEQMRFVLDREKQEAAKAPMMLTNDTSVEPMPGVPTQIESAAPAARRIVRPTRPTPAPSRRNP